jgi:hypothetical protein
MPGATKKYEEMIKNMTSVPIPKLEAPIMEETKSNREHDSKLIANFKSQKVPST